MRVLQLSFNVDYKPLYWCDSRAIRGVFGARAWIMMLQLPQLPVPTSPGRMIKYLEHNWAKKTSVSAVLAIVTKDQIGVSLSESTSNIYIRHFRLYCVVNFYIYCNWVIYYLFVSYIPFLLHRLLNSKIWNAVSGECLHTFEHNHIVRTCNFNMVWGGGSTLYQTEIYQ